MKKKSFIPKRLRPDVKGSFLENNPLIDQIKSDLSNKSLTTSHTRKSIITRLLSIPESSLKHEPILLKYKEVLKSMYPELAQQIESAQPTNH